MRLLILQICIVCMVGSLSAQTKEELERQKQQAQEEIELTRQLIEKTSKQRANSLQQVRIISRGIQSREKLIRSIESEVYLLNDDIAEIEAKIKDLSQQEARFRNEYATIIYFVYRNHTEYEKLMYLLASNSISQAYQRYKYLKYLTDYRKRVVEEIETLIAELNQEKDKLNVLMKEKLALLEQKEDEARRLSSDREKRNRMVVYLQREERRLRADVEEKIRIRNKLEEEIRKIIEEEARKLNTNNLYASLTPEQRLVSADFVKNKGVLPWPIERGVITLPYGNVDYPGLSGTKINNDGIEITGMPGSKARAVFNGEVTKVFAILGANYTVLIRHGNYLTVYQNLVNVRVKPGDNVSTKQIIGDIFTEESKGVSTIHFMIWQERNILNPEEWLSN